MRLWLWLSVRLLRNRRGRLARHSAVTAAFVVFVFTVVSMNASFDLTFHRVQDGLAAHHSVMVYSNGSISYSIPPDDWVWNSTQAQVDNASLFIWGKVKTAFDWTTWSVAAVMVGREMLQNWSEARHESEEDRTTYGLLHIAGVCPKDMWAAFFVQRILAYAIGVPAGVLLSVSWLLPYIHSQVSGTIGAVFFSSVDNMIPALVSTVMALSGASIRAAVLMRRTDYASLSETVREVV